MSVYNGKLILLGNRTTRLPSDEDLSCYKPEAAKYATIDASMPIKNDIIVIDGYEGEWFIEQSDQARTWNWRRCYMYQVTGREKVVLGQFSSLRIAYDETGLDPDFKDGVLNVRQTMYDAVQIVGQVQIVSVHVRVPSLPGGVGLVGED